MGFAIRVTMRFMRRHSSLFLSSLMLLIADSNVLSAAAYFTNSSGGAGCKCKSDCLSGDRH